MKVTRLALALFIVLAPLALAFSLEGCSARQAVATGLNVSAAAANAAAPGILAAQCRAELAAINHTGDYVGGRCVRTDEPRAATAEELAALTALRAKWGPVMRAHEAFARAHDAARVLGTAESLLDVVRAYEELRKAALEVSVTLPNISGVQ